MPFPSHPRGGDAPVRWGLVMIVTVLAGCSHLQTEVEIPKSKIQQVVDEKFPYHKNAVIARFRLESPEVYLSDPNIGVKLAYYGDLLDKEIEGRADFCGQIAYKATEGAFYVSDFDVVDISVDQASFSEPDKLEAALLMMVNNYLLKIVNDYLDGYPVYCLDQTDFKENLGKLLIKGVRVQGNNLVVALGV